MKRFMLGSGMALCLLSGPAAAKCLYQGVPYSEGARVCMHRTMFMCRGSRWVKTAELCWEKEATPTRSWQHEGEELVEVRTQTTITITACDVMTGREKGQAAKRGNGEKE